jgi:dienelactone hydrolase
MSRAKSASLVLACALALAPGLLLAPEAARAEEPYAGKALEYQADGTTFEGYVARPSGPAKGSGVLVVHEWMGLVDFTKRVCDRLAAEGHVAFAVDVYGKGVRPTTPQDAAPQAKKFREDRALFRKRVGAGLDVLAKQEGVDRKKIAAIGFCFGGTGVLELARSGADVAGVVSFHGGLSTPNPDDAKNVKGKVLVLHGADDPHVKPEEVSKFTDEMRAAKLDWQLVHYGGAVHAFTNPGAGSDPSKGAAYHEPSARRAWQAMRTFFAELFP